MKANIRNFGFERGNTDFWSVGEKGALTIDDTQHKLGLYSGKIVTDATTDNAYIEQDDLIPVEYGAIATISIFIKGVANDDISLRLNRYDADGNNIGWCVLKTGKITTSWAQIYSQYVVKPDDAYISFYMRIDSALGSAEEYIDNLDINIIRASDQVMQVQELCYLLNKTASGDTDDDMYQMFGFTSYYAELYLASLTGTNPTCQVTICEKDQMDQERVLGTFTLATAALIQRVGMAQPIGNGVYVKYVMGGTVTDCDFKVNMIGVR